MLSYLLDFYLHKEKSECGGKKEEYIGQMFSAEACADGCRGKSQLFVFGTNKFGKSQCEGRTCACYCEFETKDFKCLISVDAPGYNLYAFKGMSILLQYNYTLNLYAFNGISILLQYNYTLKSTGKFFKISYDTHVPYCPAYRATHL